MTVPQRIALGLLVGLGVLIASAFGFAVVLAVIDLHRAGHGLPTLARPWIELPARGVHLSRADVIMLAGSAVLALSAGIAAALIPPGRRGGAGASDQR